MTSIEAIAADMALLRHSLEQVRSERNQWNARALEAEAELKEYHDAQNRFWLGRPYIAQLRKDRDAHKARADDLQRLVNGYRKIPALDALTKECEVLREVLKWFADEDNYYMGQPHLTAEVLLTGSGRAQAALGVNARSPEEVR